MPWIVSGILVAVIIGLAIKLNKKVQLDNSLQQRESELQASIAALQLKSNELEAQIKTRSEIVKTYIEKINEAQGQYYEEISKKASDLDEYFKNQKRTRQSEMDTDFENLRCERQQKLELEYQKLLQVYQNKEDLLNEAFEKNCAAAEASQEAIIAETQYQQQRFESLLEPLKQYEKDKQARLYYTIQVPDEYKDDIDFLLTTVAAKVQHPDVINKLVWTEYVKPYLDDTFKRVGIEDKSGIYKITNLDSGKTYIGKSTNIKKRISDHFKSSIGIKSVADQAVHHAILKEGFWNWSLEVITYCDKEQLSELEKYYIDFFHSQSHGYNKNQGG